MQSLWSMILCEAYEVTFLFEAYKEGFDFVFPPLQKDAASHSGEGRLLNMSCNLESKWFGH